MRQLKAKIVENKRIAQGFYKMRLGAPYLARNAAPGQFVEVKCSEGQEVLLRRPLGVHRILNNGIEVLYEVVGKGTELLSRRKIGTLLDIIGPLGNGFTVPRYTIYDKRYTVLIAGGNGVAPLLALAESMAPAKRQEIYVLIGARTRSHILCKKDFKKLGCKVIIATEDGSQGKKGLVTECLKTLLSTINHELSTIYACGPMPMLKALAQITEVKQIPCQVSLEERMACGVGACLGCPVKVKTQHEYKMVCKDGPVFDAKEIAW